MKTTIVINMINSIRKFSSTIYAKVLLGIVILPFVLWGMGDVFRGGKQNTILEIDNEKFSAQDFGDYVNSLNIEPENINNKTFDIALSNFIAKNLIDTDAKNLKISSLGISNNDHLIIYDMYGMFSAARIWFMFKAFGHNNISLLNMVKFLYNLY